MAILGLPLFRSCRTGGQLPLVFKQVFKEQVAPLRRRLSPGNFRTTGNGIGPDSRAVLTFPAEALVLQRAAFGLWPHQRRVASAVSLAKAVAAGDQRDSFFVVHGHAEERLADVACRSNRIGVAVRTLRVDVDQAHLNRTERLS